MSLEAEQAVVASIIASDASYDAAIEQLTPTDFTDDRMSLLFEVIVKFKNAGKKTDLITLGAALTNMQRWIATGRDDPIEYLHALNDATHSFRVVTDYIKIVKAASTASALVDYCNSVFALTQNSDLESDEMLAQASQLLPSLDNVSGITTYLEAKQQARQGIMRRMQGEVLGVSTGLPNLDRLIVALEPSTLTIVAGRPSHGKAQPLDCKVRTPDGWVRMGDLKLGDDLSSVDGQPSKVIKIHERKIRDVYRLEFADGRSTRACPEHLWSVMYRDWEKPRVVNTLRLMEMLTKKRYKNRVWIEPVRVESRQVSELPIAPYLFGVIIGDGSLRQCSPSITNPDSDIIERCRSLLPGDDELRSDGHMGWRIVRGTRSDECSLTLKSLRKIGMMGKLSIEKRIPVEYLNSSYENRIQLIQGLVDTDGTVEKSGAMVFATSSPGLAEDFTALIRSVGGQCKTTSKIPSYTKNGVKCKGKMAYRCAVYHPNLDTLCSLPRKRDRLEKRIGKRERRLTVDSVEFIGRDETQCITVSHPTSLYVTDDYVVTHNSIYGMKFCNAASKVGPSVFFSLEMSPENLGIRGVASEGRVNLGDLRRGKLDHHQEARMEKAVVADSQYPIYIDDRGGLSPDQIRARARTLHRKQPLKLIVVDYLQLMNAPGENETTKIGNASKAMKELAKELKVPVVVLSQLNRSLEQRPDKRPIMSDLRQSGQIEQDADVILFTYIHEKYVPDTPRAGVGELICAKQRNGPLGNVYTLFEGEYQSVREFCGEVPRERVKKSTKGMSDFVEPEEAY